MALNRLSAIPYELELRYTLDAALYHWEELRAAADKCLSLDAKWQRERGIAPSDWNAKLREQALVSLTDQEQVQRMRESPRKLGYAGADFRLHPIAQASSHMTE